MTIYYSLSTNGFYDTEVVDYPTLPNDIIEITKEQHLHFIHNINMENKDRSVLIIGAFNSNSYLVRNSSKTK